MKRTRYDHAETSRPIFMRLPQDPEPTRLHRVVASALSAIEDEMAHASAVEGGPFERHAASAAPWHDEIGLRQHRIARLERLHVLFTGIEQRLRAAAR